VAIVCELRDRANEALRRAGYVASVQIPPQTVETEDLRLEVVLARVVEVRVRGDAAPYRDTLAARIDQLKALSPLNERDAERILLIAGDIPGLDVQLSLSPAGTAPGDVIGELTVIYRPYTVIANLHNLGSKQLGRETAYVGVDFYGLTGASDVTYLGASSTSDFEEQRVLLVGHELGLGSVGTTLGANLIYAWSRPDLGLLDLRSESLVARAELSSPLVRSRRETFNFTLGVELIEQRIRIHSDAGSTPLNRDKLRVGFIRADAGYREPLLNGENAYSLAGTFELRKGFDIFDATQRGKVSPLGFAPSRIAGDAAAFVVRGELEGVVGLGSIFSLAAEARGQWADKPLLNFEEFSLGNLTIGRGYDPGANSADRAVGARAELRAKVYNVAPYRAELFGFYDSVWIWNLDPNSTETDRRLGSWGGGLRATFAPYAFLEAMYARPEHRPLLIPSIRRAPDRFLVSLTLQFDPQAR
jgi:hemolysin activation/secretion protein